MKNIIRFISSLWSKVTNRLVFSKTKKSLPHSDAIGMPHLQKQQEVEDYEIAAYHQQA